MEYEKILESAKELELRAQNVCETLNLSAQKGKSVSVTDAVIRSQVIDIKFQAEKLFQLVIPY